MVTAGAMGAMGVKNPKAGWSNFLQKYSQVYIVLSLLLYIMFHQNSNDLVKIASVNSGHVQNSKETQQILSSQVGENMKKNNQQTIPVNVVEEKQPSSTLSVGTQFQQMVQGLINTVFTKEGLSVTPANPSTGILAGNSKENQGNFIISQSKQDEKYTKQELDHIEKTNNILTLINTENKNQRQKWAEVTDADGFTKYGYITKDGIFQIWHVPASAYSDSSIWLETDNMKKNAGVIGCPAPSETVQKIKISERWNNIKPFDLVYAADTGRTNPVFMMVNDTARDYRNSFKRTGIYSCNNERSNVFVSERPSADFHFSSEEGAIQNGCYVLPDKVTNDDLKKNGFTFQEDMNEVSISQCKRRAEDLGSSYFMMSATNNDVQQSRGGCWVYTKTNDPYLRGLLSFDETGSKCHTVSNQEEGEDKYLSAYSPSTLKRMYGKNTTVNIPLNPPNPDCDHKTKSRCIFENYKHEGNGVCVPQTNTPKSDENDNCGYWASIGECEKNPGYMLDRCQTSCKNTKIYQQSNIKNENREFTYGALYNYNNNDLRNWLKDLHKRNGGGFEREAVEKYIEKCKKTEGYEFLDDNPPQRSKIVKSVALYSLKNNGPTGVDSFQRNKRGNVGRISYIDHNGEKHDYPESALSYMAPSKNDKGETIPATYVNLGAYDTRSAESSYSLKEITPGSYTDAVNLLYKASRDGWSPEAFHKKCDNKGPTYTRAIINDGRVLGAYTSLSWSTTANYQNDISAFLYDGTTKYPSTNGYWGPGVNAVLMNNSLPIFGGGHDFFIHEKTLYSNIYTFLTNSGKAPFGQKKERYYEYALKDIEVYSVDPNTFPVTLEYERKLRTMPIGESITTSFEKCSGMCDADEKCGGFVYTKGSAGADGKCELKDRKTMYPNGLRIADPTKQLMLKVPTINESVNEEARKLNNGVYTMIDSLHYAHYPSRGSVSSNTIFNIRDMIPKEGSLKPTDLTALYGAVDNVTQDTQKKTAEYKEQTAVPPIQTDTDKSVIEGFSSDRVRETANSAFYTSNTNNYGQAMKGVQDTLVKIANSKYQRERLNAMTEESNKNLISESYKFILWSILAILTVLALLKLREMFGQDDADEGDGDGGGGGGILATILGWFGVKGFNMDDIPDRTEDVKAALNSAGEQLRETGANLATGITQGADNLVNSANDMATGVVEGATNLVDKAKETASNAIDQVGTAASSATSAIGIGPASSASTTTPSPTTGGRKTSSSVSLASTSMAAKSRKK